MNIFTKLVIILILVMSLVYTGFATIIFNTKENYKVMLHKKDEVTKKISDEDNAVITRKKEEFSKLDNETKSLETEKKSKASELNSSADKLNQEKNTLAELQQNITELTAENERMARDIEYERRRNEELHRDIETSRKRFQETENDLNMTEARLINDKDELARTKKELASLDEQYIELSRKYDQAKTTLDGYVANKDLKPPIIPYKDIRGKVLAVSPKTNVVVISPGENSGVKVGMEFTVSRDNKFIAKIKVDKVEETFSTAITVDGLSTDLIREQDDVTTSPF
jgi:archaellum component FlaC